MSLSSTPFSGPYATAGRSRTATATTLLVVVAVAAALLSVLVGARAVPPAALLDPDHPLRAIYEARVPRTFLALAVGAALGLAGAAMQGLTRNPLADPGLLGIHAGATFAMVIALTFVRPDSMPAYLVAAFAGAGFAAVLVHALAAMGPGGATPVRLVIAGAAVTAALTSGTSALLLTDHETLDAFRRWQVGSVAGRDDSALLTGLPFLLVGAVLVLVGARTLDALALGDDLARALGRRTAIDRAVIGLAIVLLCGTATALAGPIAFVGLMVPHAVRLFVGPAHGPVLVLSAIGGATLMCVADTVGRIVLPPSEVQVGVMCAVVGVPVFVLLLRRGRLGVL